MRTLAHTRAALLLLPLAACGGDARAGDAAGSKSAAPAAITQMAPPAGQGSAEPNLAVGADGQVYLSWVEPGADSTHALRYSVLQGERWSAPRTVASGRGWFVNWADFPSITAGANGRLAAHWLQKSGKGTYAYDVRVAVSSDAGATWTPGMVPHRDGTQSEHGFASLWPAGDSIGMVWLDGRKYGADSHGGHGGAGNEMTLQYTTVGADGRAAPEREIDGRVCDCCQTGAAMTGRGPLVVYRDRSPEEIRDIYVTRLVDGAWTAPRPVHADGWKIDACPVNGPQAAAEGDRVAVAWFTGANDSRRVKVAFSDDAGATFGAPVRVDGGDPEGRVDVLLLEGGAALVSWMERTAGKGAEVRVRHVAANGTLSAPRTITASSAARGAGFPRMVRAGDELILAWTASGEPSTVQAARMPLPRD